MTDAELDEITAKLVAKLEVTSVIERVVEEMEMSDFVELVRVPGNPLYDGDDFVTLQRKVIEYTTGITVTTMHHLIMGEEYYDTRMAGMKGSKYHCTGDRVHRSYEGSYVLAAAEFFDIIQSQNVVEKSDE